MINGLTKNNSINPSMQKISSIHSFILEIQQIIESHDLKGHSHIWPTFSFLKYALACKKSARFIHSLKLKSHAHFWPHSHPKIIKVILNFPEFASAWKISSVHLSIHYPFTLWPRWPQPFLTTPTPIFFYQLLISGINM